MVSGSRILAIAAVGSLVMLLSVAGVWFLSSMKAMKATASAAGGLDRAFEKDQARIR